MTKTLQEQGNINIAKNAMDLDVYFGGKNFYLEIDDFDYISGDIEELKDKVSEEVITKYEKMHKCGFAFGENARGVKVRVIKENTRDTITQIVNKARWKDKPQLVYFFEEIEQGRNLIKFINEAKEQEELVKKEKEREAQFEKEFEDENFEIEDIIFDFVINLKDKLKGNFKKIALYIKNKFNELPENIKNEYAVDFKEFAWKTMKVKYRFSKKTKKVILDFKLKIDGIVKNVKLIFDKDEKEMEELLNQDLFEVDSIEFTEDEKIIEDNILEFEEFEEELNEEVL